MQLSSDIDQHIHDPIQAFVVADRDLANGARPPMSLIAHTVDRSVGDKVDHTIGISKHRHSQSDAFDLSADSTNTHAVVEHVLVFKQHDESIEIVLDQILCTECNSQTDDSNTSIKTVMLAPTSSRTIMAPVMKIPTVDAF